MVNGIAFRAFRLQLQSQVPISSCSYPQYVQLKFRNAGGSSEEVMLREDAVTNGAVEFHVFSIERHELDTPKMELQKVELVE